MLTRNRRVGGATRSDLRWLRFASVMGSCSACAPADPASGSTVADDQNTEDVVDELEDGGMDSPAEDESIAVCDDGDELACQCADGVSGIKICEDGTFGRCTGCAEGNSDSLCVAGLYVGQSVGTYSGGGAFMGLIPGWNVDTKNALSLSLSSSGGEFPVINSGCIAGRLADGSIEPNAGGLITGTVDCSTGKLDGELRNYMTRANGLTGEPERVYARGEVHATYDPETSSFKGTWEQHEPPDFFGMVAGGGGTLSVALSKDAVPAEAPADATTFKDCWGFDFPDELFD